MRTRTAIPLVVAVFAFAQVQAAPPAITNLAAAQRPGTKFVDIAFSLSSETPTASILLEISSDGGSTWAVPATSTSGDIGTSVPVGPNKLIAWNSGTDWNNQSSMQMRFRLNVDDGQSPVGFAPIPSGTFTMGRNSGDTDTNAPPVTVNVSAFHMQTSEVSWDQWNLVRTWALVHGYTDLGAGEGTAANYPVNKVTWWDVIKWCNARSEMEGLTPCYTTGGAIFKTESYGPLDCYWSTNGYRLPTEAEWEKAARGGLSGLRFPWGDTISHTNATFYSDNAYSYDWSPTHGRHPVYDFGAPVGTFPANGYGLTEMAGNVREWCWDEYDAGYYASINGSTDPRGPGGPGGASSRMTRGGSSLENASHSRNCDRSSENVNASEIALGFRTSRTVAATFTSPSIALETHTAVLSLASPVPANGNVQGAGSYILNTTATLTAAAGPGYVLTTWTGDASGTTNPLSVLMDSDKSIGATFSPDTNDTDDDGWTNYQEIVMFGSDPILWDTDSDNAKDSADAFPRDPAETLDTDHDGIGDNADTDDDGDGLSDADEASTHHTNPKRADSDGDGLSDPEELGTHHTDPNIADSDGDGLSDGAEINTHSKLPKIRDTDGDGFLDGYEVLTGKSPTDILDKPALVAEARTAIEFTFPSALGKNYRIEESFDFSVWTTVESDISGTGGQIQRFYSTRNMPKRYFRVEENGP